MEEFGLSSRGAANVAAIWPLISKAVEERKQTASPVIDMATSENFLLRDELITFFKTAVCDGLQSCHFSYPNELNGDRALLKSVATFLNTHFRPSIPVESQHIIVAPGVTFTLDALLYNLFEAGDGILIPTPCWMNVRSGVQPVWGPVDTLDHVFEPSKAIQSLELAVSQSTCPIKGLLLTNPHNPLGRNYDTEMLRDLVRFCHRKRIHFISNEIYAMSSFARSGTPFTSALQLDFRGMGCDPSQVHTLWGISKDLGSNGLRMGCCVTQANKPLATGLALSSNTQLSSLTALVTTKLLTSPELPRLLEINSQRLGEAYTVMTGWLDAHALPYVAATTGCFVFARLAPHAQTWEEEAAVIDAWKQAGVSVSAGRSYHAPETAKGWARISFALPPAVLSEALRRLDLVSR
ncbi:1-aminocyclopropane-1-carboxylate synthase 7 [Xylariaceae sp. FL0594]|nr:1-aminocyclopropane-1-carboxylate synthase 7 [Xylariaceae sp. FL0594]